MAFDVQTYMTEGTERVVTSILRLSYRHPKASAAVVKFAAAAKKAAKVRRKEEDEGLHVPSFLIASITGSCNLHCAGCYARASHECSDTVPVAQLSGEEWLRIFREADELGVSFILLAGGEPLLRTDVLEAAASVPNILFPVFTNGTLLGGEVLKRLDKSRNLLPVLSIEGEEKATDHRRGEGIYAVQVKNMKAMKDLGMLFGVSVTVTRENLEEAYAEDFVSMLESYGCRAVIYVEYVPVTEESKDLAPDDNDRERMNEHLSRLRETHKDTLFISFPGDEKTSGGCLAAGRGFFHISPTGAAEPCPFSPYSDTNLRDMSVREALSSPLFLKLQSGDLLK
ncbi:MAG: radical SAM protein [Clostridia bacterium]|nr:radical SAM protein [Clostridia bacterium]